MHHRTTANFISFLDGGGGTAPIGSPDTALSDGTDTAPAGAATAATHPDLVDGASVVAVVPPTSSVRLATQLSYIDTPDRPGTQDPRTPISECETVQSTKLSP